MRYSRQTRLAEWGPSAQRRLADARVVIVGVGGLGSPAALYLATAGLGTLGLVDDDIVDVSNLQRQVLFSNRDVSRRKVRAAADELRRKNPELRVVEHDERLIAANALAITSGYDLVIDGSDNFGTKFLLNDLCLKLGIPLVHGAVNAFDGQMALFEGREGPCYRCLQPAPPRARVRNCAETGVIGAFAGMIGSMQAMLALQRLASAGETGHPLTPATGILQWVHARGIWSSQQLAVKKRPGCESCGILPEAIVLTDIVDAQCERVPSLCVSEARGMSRSVKFVDIRDEEQRSEGFIPGSLHWPFARFEAGWFPEDAGAEREEWVVYCTAGIRSQAAVRILLDAGFSRVSSLEGGFDAWLRS